MRSFPTLDFQVKIPQEWFFNTLVLYEKETHEMIEEEFKKIDIHSMFKKSIQQLAENIIHSKVDSLRYKKFDSKGLNNLYMDEAIIERLFKPELEQLNKKLDQEIEKFFKYIVSPKMDILINNYNKRQKDLDNEW